MQEKTATQGQQGAQAPAGRGRDLGVDLARGLAVVLMIQTHAYDSWTSAAAKRTVAYHLTRILGVIPAPLFLLLAGVGLALGSEAALRRGRAPQAARAQLFRRGLEIVGWGYLVSLAYALLDGSFRAADLLRADILHCIGLSIMACAVLLVARPHLLRRAALLTTAALLAGPLLYPLLGPVPAWLRPLLALFIDVPPYTRFPMLPLVGFVAAGLCAGKWLAAGRMRAGPVPLLALVLVAAVCHQATALVVAAWGGTLSRTHPAVVFNFLDGTARALAVLVLAMWMAGAPPLPGLVRLGRASLLAYAFHIPFCYGRPGRLLAQRLDMAQATLALLALVALTYLAVRARDWLRYGARGSACSIGRRAR